MTEQASERKAFKDYFDRGAAQSLAKQIAATYPRFDKSDFVRRATSGLGKLEFAGRVQQFSDALAANLPTAIPRALAILSRSLPSPLPDCEQVTDGWLQWPLGQFIADHGRDHFDDSMATMIELTKRFTSEFAVRPFVEQQPERTFARLLALTDDPNPHVRRWCSEGVRPRLPWGKKLVALVNDPGPILPILDALKDDVEIYVRRSVANNLNDIAKDHPELVIQQCRTWQQDTDQRRWLINHSLRTLIKAGSPEALDLIGFKPPRKISAELSITPTRIVIGDSIQLQVDLLNNSARTQKLLVDYVVHYVRRADKMSGKVFKWKQLELPAGKAVSLKKKHSLKQTTIRALYPGSHRVEVQVNGEPLADGKFTLDAS